MKQHRGSYMIELSKKQRKEVVTENVRHCPRHSNKYVLRKGTNRCPVGRKLKINCA